MFEPIAKVLRLLRFESKPRTMSKDTLKGIIDSTLSLDTTSFLRDMRLLAMVSAPDVDTVLNRFMVRSLTHCKDTEKFPAHEFIIINIIDNETSNSPNSLMYLERTASDRRPPPAAGYTDHPDHIPIVKRVIEAAKNTLLSRPTPFPYESLGESESTPGPSSASVSLALLGAAALVSTKSSRSSTPSISGVYIADDRFVGGQHAPSYASSSHNIQQILPRELSLFDLVVIADTVHTHDPIYSILGGHCYWFANLICEVVKKEYDCSILADNRLPTGSVYIPPNKYLPDLAGTWRGLPVSTIEEEVVRVMVSKFRIHRDEQRAVVSLFFHPECRFLTLRYR